MKITIRLLYAILLTVVLCLACSGEDTEPIEYTDAADTVRVDIGKQFKIVLETNPSTGYEWQFTSPVDSSLLKLVEYKYQPKPNPEKLVGRGGHAHWTFKALREGATTVALQYLRPWDSTSVHRELVFAVEIAEK